MAARRDRTPPYEIMSSVGRGAPAEAGAAAPSRPSPPARDEGHVEVGGPATGEAAWWSWSGVGVPIILRVPRGVAILAVAGLIGLLVLAYWVGHTRGEAAAVALQQEQTYENPQADDRAAPGPPPGSSTDQQAPTQQGGGNANMSDFGAARAAGAERRAGDPREVGLNYLIVASYPRDYAEQCANFLAIRGVETYLDPLDNGRLVAIWAVDHGFTADELGGDAHQAWEARLKDLGRAWAEHNNARDNFGSMYPAKFKGE